VTPELRTAHQTAGPAVVEAVTAYLRGTSGLDPRYAELRRLLADQLDQGPVDGDDGPAAPVVDLLARWQLTAGDEFVRAPVGYFLRIAEARRESGEATGVGALYAALGAEIDAALLATWA